MRPLCELTIGTETAALVAEATIRTTPPKVTLIIAEITGRMQRPFPRTARPFSAIGVYVTIDISAASLSRPIPSLRVRAIISLTIAIPTLGVALIPRILAIVAAKHARASMPFRVVVPSGLGAAITPQEAVRTQECL